MLTVVSKDGTHIAFEKTGKGPPLVLLPAGGGNDHTRWELAGVREAFARQFTTYAVDTRGLGQSGDSDEYSLDREFEDVAAVVDSIDEPVNLLGHSSGALLALNAALLTDNLRTLILYEPPIMVGEHELYSKEVLAELKRLLGMGEREQFLITFLQDVGGASTAEIDMLRKAPNWQNRVDAAHVILRGLQEVGHYRFDAARFAEMTIPTLLLTGSESSPPFRDATNLVHEALPNSRIVIFEGHGHVATLTATDRFIDEVISFINNNEDREYKGGH